MGKRGGGSERGDLVVCSVLVGIRGCESLGGWFGSLGYCGLPEISSGVG